MGQHVCERQLTQPPPGLGGPKVVQVLNKMSTWLVCGEELLPLDDFRAQTPQRPSVNREREIRITKQNLWCSVWQTTYLHAELLDVAEWGPVAWITSVHIAQVTQNHLKQRGQVINVLAELETCVSVRPIRIAADVATSALAEPHPLDQHVLGLDVRMHKAMHVQVCTCMKQASHHKLYLQLHEGPLLAHVAQGCIESRVHKQNCIMLDKNIEQPQDDWVGGKSS